MYNILFYINGWYDLRDYIISSDSIPYISRNPDCTLIIEEFVMRVKESVKDLFGSEFKFEAGTGVHIKRDNITIFSGYILRSEYNYISNAFELRIISDLAKLKKVKYNYLNIHDRIINTTDSWLYQSFGLGNNYFVNPIWLLKAIFDASNLSLDITSLLDKTFCYVDWDKSGNRVAAKYKQLFTSEAAMYYADKNYYGVKLNPLIQPKIVQKIEYGIYDNKPYYDYLFSEINDWAYSHHLDEGDYVRLEYYCIRTMLDADFIYPNKVLKSSEVVTTEEARKATRFRIYNELLKDDAYAQEVWLNTLKNSDIYYYIDVYILKFTDFVPTCFDIANQLLSILGLQVYYNGYNSFILDIGNTFDIDPNSNNYGIYIPQNYNIIDDEIYNYREINNTIEEDEYNIKLKASQGSTIKATWENIYGKIDTETIEYGVGESAVNIMNNIEICIRSGTDYPFSFVQLPFKMPTMRENNIMYLYTASTNSVTFTDYQLQHYDSIPSAFLHKYLEKYITQIIEITCDAKTEKKGILENFINMERDESTIKYINNVGLTL